ncbi:MAG TPA: hypothetical protein VNV37_03895 [Solirubrobacteraceae bacterium]|jgi:hypothetical protein|nr:hypothetical protein [Solirubrobacteraceae bacterium]
MQGQPEERRGGESWKIERAVVLQLLRDDHEQRWTRAELASEISDFEAAAVEEALTRLEHDGVLRREGAAVWASCAARRLDELELISV